MRHRFDCSSSAKRNKVHYHRQLLVDWERLNKWISNMKLKDPPISKNSCLCSNHFATSLSQSQHNEKFANNKPAAGNSPLSLSLRLASIYQLPPNDVSRLFYATHHHFFLIAIAALAKSFRHIKVGKVFLSRNIFLTVFCCHRASPLRSSTRGA